MGTRRWWIVISVICALAGSESRSVSGVVTDKRGNLLPGSVVEIDNPITKDIRSYIVQADGRYHFNDLNPDVDFVLQAQYHGHLSKSWTLSKFSGTKSAKADFIIPID